MTQIVHIASQLAAIVRKNVAMRDLREAQQTARKILADALSAADVRPLGRPLTVWRPPQNGLMDYAPGNLVPHVFDVPDHVSLFTLPEGQAAHVRLTGPYDGLPAAWGQLFADCERLGARPAGLNWEIYPDPDDSAEPSTTDLYALLI